MLKNLLCALLILCSSACKADTFDNSHFSLVITLDPGETVMVKSADGKYSTYIDYSAKKANKDVIQKGISADESYHLEYHLVIWMQCPACTMHYNAAEVGCRNPFCPQRML